MNQPKFKFGDNLIKKRQGWPDIVFVVEWVRILEGVFNYSPSSMAVCYPENELELQEEPQKKKLYAYRVIGCLGEIKTFMKELEPKIAEVNNLIRDLDYDIEYQEDK